MCDCLHMQLTGVRAVCCLHAGALLTVASATSCQMHGVTPCTDNLSQRTLRYPAISGLDAFALRN